MKAIVTIHTEINQAGEYRTRVTVDGITTIGEWGDVIYANAEADEVAWIWREDTVTRSADSPAQSWLTL